MRRTLRSGIAATMSGDRDLARCELQSTLADDAHTLRFQRKRDRIWMLRAKWLLRKNGLK